MTPSQFHSQLLLLSQLLPLELIEIIPTATESSSFAHNLTKTPTDAKNYYATVTIPVTHCTNIHCYITYDPIIYHCPIFYFRVFLRERGLTDCGKRWDSFGAGNAKGHWVLRWAEWERIWTMWRRGSSSSLGDNFTQEHRRQPPSDSLSHIQNKLQQQEDYQELETLELEDDMAEDSDSSSIHSISDDEEPCSNDIAVTTSPPSGPVEVVESHNSRLVVKLVECQLPGAGGGFWWQVHPCRTQFLMGFSSHSNSRGEKNASFSDIQESNNPGDLLFWLSAIFRELGVSRCREVSTTEHESHSLKGLWWCRLSDIVPEWQRRLHDL